MKKIPIFIVSYNRLYDLQKIISVFEKDGYDNLIILDNASTDSELLAYLRKIKNKYTVHFFTENFGHLVLWRCGLYDEYIQSHYYVLTDPDLIPIDECPSNYVEVFYNILQKFPQKRKVGFSLKIDDIPDYYPYKWDIIRFESFFKKKIKDDNYTLYDAPIDTTFALYSPGKLHADSNINFSSAIRVGYPFVVRHSSWYIKPESMTQKQVKYFEGVKSTTALNPTAIESGRRTMIGWLANMQSGDLYEVIKRICTKSFIRNNVTYKGIVKMFFFVLYAKILQSIRRGE